MGGRFCLSGQLLGEAAEVMWRRAYVTRSVEVHLYRRGVSRHYAALRRRLDLCLAALRVLLRLLHVWEFRDGLISRENVWLDSGSIVAHLTSEEEVPLPHTQNAGT